MKVIKDYSLRCYVRDFLSANAGKRGGEMFTPYYKKDLKPFRIRVMNAANRSAKCLDLIQDKYPITFN